ncbi:restriction endonuclease subunit S [Imhoffiella purpurea]|uniref:Type I restriction-modification system, specificity subunit S n=1 Tax=Imhoffiella purpurea TaxID=1249627 RepID=W9V507_9GAMM|nr:restriction endonuclease subunit S [Imhoffiella purpurea]EXJ14389.1 Type I restriction-modification system, specificity subunit S [Imhoffiella purpurea]
MNPDSLLALYERIADAPDAVARLRRFILDLAVRGKLVPQDPADEPATELMTRITEEKTRLVKAGRIRRLQVDPVIPEEEPFITPSAWIWTRLGSVGDWGSGSTPPRGNPDFYGGDITWLKSGELNDNRQLSGSEETLTEYAVRNGAFRLNQPGDVLIAMYGATIGKLAILAEQAVTNQAVCGCTPLRGVSNQFLFLYLLSQRAQFRSASEGGAQPNISKVKIVWTPFPLPPLAEQHRIVAKVDELMALCDRLEAARAQRESTRDRLAAASLARLNAPDQATFIEHARFALDTLPALTIRSDQIKQLRQTILNLAVRGKLVAQNPDDEPADKLLERITGARSSLTDIRGIRRVKALPPITDAETKFELPDGWAWTRLGNLSQFVTSGSRDWAQYHSNEGAIFVRMGNLSKDHYHLRLDHVQRVKPPADGEGTRTRLEAGDILISITGDVGMLGLIPEGFGEAYINQHTAMVRPMPEMQGRYLPELFRSPFAQDQFNEPQRGIKNSFRLTDVTQFVVPLPPLPEQHRIVAKVDELMALCDRLEASLATTDSTRRRLLDALLHEALAPTEIADSIEPAKALAS